MSCGDKRHACHLSYRYSVGSVDIIGMLVDIYGSTDLFLNEYRSLLSDKLLALTSYQIDREVHNVELLKIRFGEVGYIMCRRISSAVSCVRDMTWRLSCVGAYHLGYHRRRISCGLSSRHHLAYQVCLVSRRVYHVICVQCLISRRLYHVMICVQCLISRRLYHVAYIMSCPILCHLCHVSTHQVPSKRRCEKVLLVFAYTCLLACLLIPACLVGCSIRACMLHICIQPHTCILDACCTHASNLRIHVYIYIHMGAYRYKYRWIRMIWLDHI